MEDTETGILGDKKTRTSLMKPPISLISGRLQPCLIIVACLMILLSIFFIPFWIIKLNQIEHDMDSLNLNVGQQLISSEIKTITNLFYNPLNSTATNLATILSSAIEDEDALSFSTIQSKVAPVLFQALTLTVPWLSQVYYAGLDGLFFSYYYTGDDRSTPIALYSNSSNNVTGQTWYSQPVNRDNGKLHGDATNVTYALQEMNASWIQEAIAHHAKGYGSLGHILNNPEEDRDDPLFMSIAGLKNKLGAVSLGFSVNSLTNLLSNGGKLFLSTLDGRVLIQGIANTSLVVDAGHGSVSLVTVNGGYRHDRINCGREKGVELRGGESVGYCEFVDILGVKSVYAVLVPGAKIKNEGLVHKDVKLAKIIGISMGGAVLFLAIFFIVVMVKTRRREMLLRASLIKQMEATQQAERRCMNKSLAVTSASHDIRASLAGLVGLIEFCRERASSAGMAELEMNLVQMETCAKDLLRILNSVMNISKIEAGKIELEEEVFSMSNLLEEVVDLYHPAGMKKGVDMILDPCDGSISRLQYLVRGDRTKLKQILWNLLNNAVKFTSEGHIVVRAWARSPSLLKEERDMFSSCTQTNSFCCFLGNFKDDNVGSLSRRRDPNCWEFVIEVEDTGKGIPKEKQKFVFENYVQVKETAVANPQGTGLGLGIVQSLVRIMGGEITIVDKDQASYERGTCFRFNTLMTLENSLGSGGSRLQSSSSSSPKPDQNSSVVVLFIQSNQRQLVIEKFMTSMGIKVHAVKEWENFPRVLKKVKQKLLSNNISSGRSDVSSRMDCMSSLSRSAASRNSSNTKIKEFPLSSMVDGKDEQLKVPNFVLLVIDANGGPFRDLSRAVAEFRRDIHESCCCTRIVWIDKPAGESIHSKGLDEDKLPPTDLIVYKPLHGSQLDNIISLLPEFGGSTVPTRRRRVSSEQFNHPENFDIGMSSYSNTAFQQGANRNGEIQQESEINGDKVLEGKRVLIVEDNGMLRMLARNIVSRLGGSVEVCENGEEAVGLVCKRLISRTSTSSSATHQNMNQTSILPLYDYILMDCEMPIMDGFEATTRIREEEIRYGVHIPIIALTAHTKEEVKAKKRMFEVGMDFHLIKPLTTKQLIDAVASLSLHHQHHYQYHHHYHQNSSF